MSQAIDVGTYVGLIELVSESELMRRGIEINRCKSLLILRVLKYEHNSEVIASSQNRVCVEGRRVEILRREETNPKEHNEEFDPGSD